MKKPFLLLSLCAGALSMLCSCETTELSTNHEPYYDYWSGACCPQHAHQFVKKKESAEPSSTDQ